METRDFIMKREPPPSQVEQKKFPCPESQLAESLKLRKISQFCLDK